MKDGVKIIGIGLLSIFATAFVGLIFLFNGGFPVFDPGISGNNFTMMSIERTSTLPYPSEPYANISESQINQCPILKTTYQELIDNNQDSRKIELNSSEYNCISSFLESLTPKPDISWVYYQGFFFHITFSVG